MVPPMHEIHETPRTVVVAVLFCTIIGIIAYAAFGSGMAGHKAQALLAASKPEVHDDAGGLLP